MLLLVVLAFLLQSRWMQRAKERGAAEIAPNALAEKITVWMMQARGEKPGADVRFPDAPGVEKIECGNCMGTGTALAADGQKGICPICRGVGFGLVRRLDPADRICPACGGMGRLLMPDTGAPEECPRCGGRGLIRSRIEPESAPVGN